MSLEPAKPDGYAVDDPPEGAIDGWADYSVPVSAIGRVGVRARDADEAFDYVQEHVRGHEVARYLEISGDEVYREAVTEGWDMGEPVNVAAEGIPTIPRAGALGEDLRRARERMGLSIAEVAARTDFSASAIGRIERGEVASLDRIREYAHALRRQPEVVLDG